jgi:hypothetical protein
MTDGLLKDLTSSLNKENQLAPALERLSPLLFQLANQVLSGEESRLPLFHRALFSLNYKSHQSKQHIPLQQSILIESFCQYMEDRWLQYALSKQEDTLTGLPTKPQAFMTWFSQLCLSYRHPIFNYLEKYSTLAEITTFIPLQEEIHQNLFTVNRLYHHIPHIIKESFQPDDMHLDGMTFSTEDKDWERLALINLTCAFSRKEKQLFRGLGAMASFDFATAHHYTSVLNGLKRLSVPAYQHQVYSTFATERLLKTQQWQENILSTLILQSPQTMLDLAEGALVFFETQHQVYDLLLYQFRHNQVFTPKLKEFTTAHAPHPSDKFPTTTRFASMKQ